MSLLNYVFYSNPTSYKDVISKIRSFAIAQGWTVDDYQTSKQWLWDSVNSKYDWLATGNAEDFLQLYSAGYGNQDVVVRIWGEATGADSQAETVWFAGINPAHRTPSDQSSTTPANQDPYAYVYTRRISLSTGTMPGLWLFGNDKFIIGIIQVQSDFLQMFYAGTIEMFYENESEGFYHVITSHYANTLVKWYDAKASAANYWNFPWNLVGSTALPTGWMEDQSAAGRWQTNCRCGQSVAAQGILTELGYAVKANTFTGKRTLIKPTVFYKSRTDDIYYPVGTFPLYYIKYQGLTIGQTLTYGSEQYLVFPECFVDRIYGVAFRIA